MHSLVKIKLQQDFGPDKFIPDKELTALMKVLPNIKVGCSLHAASESRRDQEEGCELDSHEEPSPEEIKSMEMVLG